MLMITVLVAVVEPTSCQRLFGTDGANLGAGALHTFSRPDAMVELAVALGCGAVGLDGLVALGVAPESGH